MAIAVARPADRYELGRLLGAGAVSDVYAGRDRLLHRPVAIKVLRPKPADDSDFVARFQRAVSGAIQVGHPNTLAIYGIGVHRGRRCLVTELVRGRTLADREEGWGRLSQARLVGAPGSGAVLAVAHARGRIHGDVRPGSVMLTDGGRMKVLNLGMADLYGFGVWLYECLTGHAPFTGASPVEVPPRLSGKARHRCAGCARICPSAWNRW